MIEKLITTDVTEFNKETLAKLKPYFDLNHFDCLSEDRHLWFQNLLALAQHSLGIAHCVQHNHTARLLMLAGFKDQKFPDFYDYTYENQIGCYSNAKSADELTLVGKTISGTKRWISMAHQADFGIFRVPANDTDAYVLIDFAETNPTIDLSYTRPIGMEIACAGSIIVDHYTLPESYILGHYNYYDTVHKFSWVNSIADYGFITNYLGLLLSLYREVKTYTEQRQEITSEFKKIGLEISSLVMAWQDNLPTVDVEVPTDEFWHRRNTQYTQSKSTLIELIALILKECDTRWLNVNGSDNQRFRDALTFCSHMKPLYRNLDEKNFIKL